MLAAARFVALVCAASIREGRRSEALPPGAAEADERAADRGPGYGFPLLLFGGLTALSVPLSALASPQPPAGITEVAISYPTVTQAMYLGGGVVAGPSPFPLGWYWAAVLAVGLAWGKPVLADGPGTPAWIWLDALWRLGTFALLARPARS